MTTDVKIYLKLPCSDPFLRDVSGEPFTVLRMEPTGRVGRPYDEFHNIPTIDEPYRISLNNCDDNWMVRDYQNAMHAAADFGAIMFMARSFPSLDSKFFESMGFRKE